MNRWRRGWYRTVFQIGCAASILVLCTLGASLRLYVSIGLGSFHATLWPGTLRLLRVYPPDSQPSRHRAAWHLYAGQQTADIDRWVSLWPSRYIRFNFRPSSYEFERGIDLPLPTVLATAALATSLLWAAGRRRYTSGHCQHCGYDLTGNVSGTCPECGVGHPR